MIEKFVPPEATMKSGDFFFLFSLTLVPPD